MPEPKFNREFHLNSRKRQEGSFSKDLSFHLEDLRNLILAVVAILLITFTLAFYFSTPVTELLQKLAPQGSSFFQLKPGELFFVSLKQSFFIALYSSMPFLILQLYLFLKPALKPEEDKVIVFVAYLAPILFFLGLAFAYFFMLPPLLDFLLNFREGLVEQRYGLDSFINLVLSIETITAISFQLPVVIFVLGLLNIVSVEKLFAIWRYVVLFAFVLAAFLTPTPDPFTMSLLACALLFLYFSTILLLKIFKAKPKEVKA